MPKYLFDYRYNGDEYGVDIEADTLSEAKARLSAMSFARYAGEIKATIKVPGGGWLWKLFGKRR